MRRSHYLVIILLLICQTSFGQIYQNMAQPGYKFSRARFDSVLSIPIGLGNLKNISGGQDTGQIRFNKSDSSVYVWNGRAWIKAGGGTIPTLTQVLESAAGANEAGANQIKDLAAGTSQFDAATFGQLTDTANLRLRLSDTATMLAPYTRVTVTSYGKNASADSTILLLSNGTRYAAKDSVGGSSSGGSSISYYLNGGTAASVGTYFQMSKNAVLGTNADFTITGNGLISQFLTDVGDPNRLQIPAGNWNFEMFFSMSSSGGTPQFYVELLKYDGTTFTSITSSSLIPETINGGTSIDLYLTSLAIPATTLLATDRLALRVYIVNNSGGRTATLHTQDSHLCQIITNFAGGISALNGLIENTQYFATGTSGTDFAINSTADTHTFNLPTASATNRGALSSTDWSTFNNKLSVTSYGKNAGGDSTILLLSNGTRYAAKDSVGGGGASGWSLTGNASAVTDFLGTTNNRTMRFRTNNVERMVIDSVGIVSILDSVARLRIASGLNDRDAFVELFEGNNALPSQFGSYLGHRGGTNITEIGTITSTVKVPFIGYNSNTDQIVQRKTIIGDQVRTTARFNVGQTNPATNSGIVAEFSRSGGGDIGIAFLQNGVSSFAIKQKAGGGLSFLDGGYAGSEGTERGRFTPNGNFNIGSNTEISSAILNATSTTKGLLIPRMTLTQRNAIASPAAGLQVIVTGETGGEFLSFYNSSTAAWQRVVKLTSAGRLLLGTTTEGTHILDVVGTARVSGQMTINGYTVSSPGSGSIKIGINPNTTGSGNTAVGEGAITTNGYSNSSAFGLGALGLGSGNRVTALGWYAGYSNNGGFNTYVGAQSGWNQTTGTNNVFVGDRAGDKISGGSTNLTIANNSILIGQNTKALADNQTNQIVIGYDETGLGSNTTIIGNSSTVTTAIRGRVLIGTTTVNTSAALNITSTTQGVLFPRMTTVEKLAIGTPAAGLQVYDTTLNQMSYYNGTAWVNF